MPGRQKNLDRMSGLVCSFTHRFLTLLYRSMHSGVGYYKIKRKKWFTNKISAIFVKKTLSPLTLFKVAVSRDCLVFFYFMNQTHLGP